MKSIASKFVVCLALVFCYGADHPPVTAQNSGVLSKDPPVLKIFDPAKNASTVSAMLVRNSDLRAVIGLDPDRLPPDVRLNTVEYTYPGTIPARPQTVAFMFRPLDKYKTAPNFSLTVDGTVVHEGEATLRELCCVKVNGHTDNPQDIVVSVPLDIFERLTHTKKIEIKLVSKRGKYSFKLDDYQRKCLAALASTIK